MTALPYMKGIAILHVLQGTTKRVNLVYYVTLAAILVLAPPVQTALLVTGCITTTSSVFKSVLKATKPEMGFAKNLVKAPAKPAKTIL